MNKWWFFFLAKMPQWPFFFLLTRQQTVSEMTDNATAYLPPPPWKIFYMYNFWQTRYPFCVPSIDKWFPFLIASLECCIPFNCFKCDWLTAEPKCSWLFHSYKMHLLALLGHRPKWQISQALGFQIPWITIVRFCAQRSWETVSNNFFVPWNLIGAPFYFF